jgi:arginine decarboxylase
VNKSLQTKAPIYEALLKFKSLRVVPFDVPGHKQGRGNPELVELLGKQCLSVDVNSMKPLDNLCHPVSVIKEGEELAAQAFGAEHVFFIVNGTTAAVQSMIMSTCKRNEKIIMPRNVHRSAINALVICGAIPVYVDPGVDKKLGIPLGMSIKDVERAVIENPDAKAIFVNNPTYYGVCSDLKAIVQLAHNNNMKVLVDEAHGTHFYFGEDMPVSAMSAGADMAAVSMHKTGGSLTQSSFLLTGKNINEGYVRQIINLMQTTSGSYLLLSSLDISRRNLAIGGKEIFKKVLYLAEYARSEINKIGGYYAFSKELIDGSKFYDFDKTKLSVHTRDIGLAGIEVYDMLRDDYGIQIEFGDIGNILAIISVGDRELELERLVSSLSEIKRLYSKDKSGMLSVEYINPEVVMAPQEAFYKDKYSLPIKESNGYVCGEFVMCYPPGIPILAPGERITKDIIEYIEYAKNKGSLLTGTEDMKIENIKVLKSQHCTL